MAVCDGSQRTLCWREPDSNHRSRPEQLLSSRSLPPVASGGECVPGIERGWRGPPLPGAPGAIPLGRRWSGAFRLRANGDAAVRRRASAFHRRIEHLQGAAAGIDLVVMETAPLPGSAAGSSRCPARHCRLNGHRRGWLGSAPRRSFPIPGRSAGPPRKGGRGIFIAEVSRPLTAFPAWLLFLVNRNNKSNIRFRNTPDVLLSIGCMVSESLVALPTTS